MEIDSADVVVIGGGVIGLSTAYFTSKSGMDVILVDKGIPGWEASGRNGGWAHAFGSNERVCKILSENIDIWQRLADELSSETEFVLGGALTVALTEEEVFEQDVSVETNLKAGVQARKVDLQEMREILPGVTDRALGGSFYPISGQANPQMTSQAWLWANERNGVRVYQDTEVTGIGVEDGRVIRVDTKSGSFGAEKVVNAAGPWASVVNEMVGQPLPVRAVKIEMLCTVPVPPLTKATFGGNGLYCRQGINGHLHFGGPQGIRTDIRQATSKPTISLFTGDTARRFAELVPSMRDATVLRTWAGYVAPTPDHLPIIDKLGAPEGFYVNTGFGGVGFAWSPVAGKIMSDLVVSGESSLDVSDLKLERVAGIMEFDPMDFFHEDAVTRRGH